MNQTRWVVPVLPGQELEVLLDAAISLSDLLVVGEQVVRNEMGIELPPKTIDLTCEPCLRFYREGVVISFQKIYTDEAVHNWKSEIHRCIFENSRRFVHLAALKVRQDIYPVIELLSYVLNPQARFHIVTAVRPSYLVPSAPARIAPGFGYGVGTGPGIGVGTGPGIGAGTGPGTGTGTGIGGGTSARVTSATATVPTSGTTTSEQPGGDLDAPSPLHSEMAPALSSSPSASTATLSGAPGAPDQPAPPLPPSSVPVALLEHKFARPPDARTQKCMSGSNATRIGITTQFPIRFHVYHSFTQCILASKHYGLCSLSLYQFSISSHRAVLCVYLHTVTS